MDLQTNVKAMQSPAYAHRVKLTNLQQMANTIIYVQEHGIDTQTELKRMLLDTQKELAEYQDQLAQHVTKAKTLNNQIHYTGQYFANKETYSKFVKSKIKGKYRKKHAAEIQAFEEARDWLKSFYQDRKMTGIKDLKIQKNNLQQTIDSDKASMPYDYTLQPGEIARIPLGFGLIIPDGFAGYVFPRSSMAAKGLVCELPPIDSGYRGEIHAILSNVSTETQIIHKDTRVGQLVITPVLIADFVLDLGNERGTGAFGSTGE